MSSTLSQITISNVLRSFIRGDLASNARSLLRTLGYRSDRTIAFEPNTAEGFIETFAQFGEMNRGRAQLQEWRSIDFLFQLTQAEIIENTQLQIAFGNYPRHERIIESYLFFAVRLRGSKYNRSQLSQITHEINNLTPIPAMVIFQYGSFLALAIVGRRPHKFRPNRDVLEKVALIENIDLIVPDNAHAEILFNLSLDELYRQYQFRSFLKFHQALQETLGSFDPSKLKPWKSAKSRYDHDKYFREEIAKADTDPYQVMRDIFDRPYEAIFDDLEYEMNAAEYDFFTDPEYEIETRNRDEIASIIKGEYKIV